MENLELRSAMSALTEALTAELSRRFDSAVTSYIENHPALSSVAQGYTDIKGASEYLGRTEWAVRGLVKRRAIPYYKIDNKVQFRYAELDTYMEQSKVKPLNS